jgi:hypothetical protein
MPLTHFTNRTSHSPQPHTHCIESGQSLAHSRNNLLIDNSSLSGILFVPEMIQINHMKGTTGQSRFHRINLITGWSVGLIACTVFVMTMEATGSFWDCGEFISSCYKLQIPHPPGAPLFVLLGRFFILLFGDNPHTAARAVNFMSAIASGLSILFLFWTITHFARKIVQQGNTRNHPDNRDAGPDHRHAEPDNSQLITIMSCGVIGALAYTFCDSFWYSAVEGEVYASSAFFTAMVFWAILKWEQNADDPALAAKVTASMKKDLEQQLRYYNSLGVSMTNEQPAFNARAALQGKSFSLSGRQLTFAQDIVSAWQLLRQVQQWEEQYEKARTMQQKPQ